MDPFYLSWKAKQFGVATRFIELAGEVNESMPAYVVKTTARALERAGTTLLGARVLVLGGGVVGVYAARVARGLGADVTILERSDQRLRYLDERFEGSVRSVMSDAHSIIEQLASSDAVIGAVILLLIVGYFKKK